MTIIDFLFRESGGRNWTHNQLKLVEILAKAKSVYLSVL